VFGGWAAIAPLDGAAHAPGKVIVKSYKKTIQHLEGGIVGSISAQNGDVVEKGAVLLQIDSSQSLAQLEIAKTELISNQAKEARLVAEQTDIKEINFPESWPAQNPDYRREVLSQTSIFDARRESHDGSIAVLEQRIEQYETRLIGLNALKTSKEALANSFSDELADVRALLSQGFSDKVRLRGIERNLAAYQGEAAELLASIATTQVQIGETNLQILQLDRERKNEVASQLAQVQTQLKDSIERVMAIQDVVNRQAIRAPSDGIVNGLQVHTVGGVIGPGSQIAEIVPASEELILEAQVSPLDIDRVIPGQIAKIRFSSFGNSAPSTTGKLLSLSADTIIDQMSGQPYYLARLEVTPESLVDLGGLELMPGMPAEVFIATGSRTLLQYMFKPFMNTLARSFIED
jgi:epimerase transport system membrane fusion protein